MRFSTTAIVLAVAGFAAAQSATSASSAPSATATGTSSCAAQNILDACLTSTKTQLDACAANDYGCYCDQYTNVLTCYNNCPNDPNRFGIQQEQTQNCNAAKAYGTTSSIISAKSTATSASSASSATASGSGSSVASGFSSASGTASGTKSTATGAAAHVVVSGGLLGAVAGVFGLLL